jgi:3-mercaptopyruvate sulfurtransferase SseA
MDMLVVNNNDQHSEPSPRPGHIAGAAHLDWVELIDPDAKTFKPAAELRALSE